MGEKGEWMIAEAKHRRIVKLLESGFGIRRTARLVGVGVRTVQRRADLLRVADLAPNEVDFRRTVIKRRCPEHGMVGIWPCVACAARGNAPSNQSEDLRD